MRCPRGLFRKLLLFVATGLIPAFASADTVWVGEPGKSLERPNLTVLGIKDDQLEYKSNSTGTAGHFQLNRVAKLKVDGEVPFNAAEEAFEKKDWPAAVEGYRKAIASSAKPFVKARALTRLGEAAAEGKQFDMEVTAFVELAKVDPAAAAAKKPAVPTDKAQLAAVTAIVRRAYGEKANDLLKGYLLDLYLAGGNQEEAAKLAGAVAPPAGGTAGASDPAAQAAARLGQAKVALATKNYAAVLQAIDGGRALFTQPEQQLDALYLVAEAKNGLAKDPAAWQDAAVAYMRVVAHFDGKSTSPAVPDSMLKAAQLVEKLNQPKEAQKLYSDLANDARWKGTPAADEAAKAVTRLGAKPG